jgi:RNA polymerase sigma factor (TIGR02999 family)
VKSRVIAMQAVGITKLVEEWRAGRREALDQLTPLIYRELRRIAAIHVRRERAGHTLTPTALANEAYLQLTACNGLDCQNRDHFFRIAARMIRQILVHHARTRNRLKRGGGQQPSTLNEFVHAAGWDTNLIRLDDALRDLESLHPRKAGVVEMRYFGGMTVEEIAAALSISEATVQRDLRLGHALLHLALSPDSVQEKVQ